MALVLAVGAILCIPYTALELLCEKWRLILFYGKKQFYPG